MMRFEENDKDRKKQNRGFPLRLVNFLFIHNLTFLFLAYINRNANVVLTFMGWTAFFDLLLPLISFIKHKRELKIARAVGDKNAEIRTLRIIMYNLWHVLLIILMLPLFIGAINMS